MSEQPIALAADLPPSGPVSVPVPASSPPWYQRWSGIIALLLAAGTLLGGLWAAVGVLGDQRWVRLQAAAATRAEQVARDVAQDEALRRAEAERHAQEQATAAERATVQRQLGELQGTSTAVLEEVRALRRAQQPRRVR